MTLLLLAVYGLAVFGLLVYGLNAYVLVWACLRSRGANLARLAAVRLADDRRDDELPRVTVQLPVFNERYVVERLLRAAAFSVLRMSLSGKASWKAG